MSTIEPCPEGQHDFHPRQGPDRKLYLRCIKCNFDILAEALHEGHPAVVMIKALLCKCERLEAERIAMQNDDKLLTCVFCGHQYPPGTPESNHASLKAHVAVCPDHPAKVYRDLLETVVDEASHTKQDGGLREWQVTIDRSTLMGIENALTGKYKYPSEPTDDNPT